MIQIMAAFYLEYSFVTLCLDLKTFCSPKGNNQVFGGFQMQHLFFFFFFFLLLHLLVKVLLLVMALCLGSGDSSLKDGDVYNGGVLFFLLSDLSEMESYHSYSPPEERRSRQSDLSSHSSNERDNPR